MYIKKAEGVSGNAIEFGEGSISYNPGSGAMFAGSSSKNKNTPRFKKRRVYQLGVSIPDARRKESSGSECDDPQSSGR